VPGSPSGCWKRSSPISPLSCCAPRPWCSLSRKRVAIGPRAFAPGLRKL
jgi:hypothetical protein